MRKALFKKRQKAHIRRKEVQDAKEKYKFFSGNFSQVIKIFKGDLIRKLSILWIYMKFLFILQVFDENQKMKDQSSYKDEATAGK